jgi:hypothetical protein
MYISASTSSHNIKQIGGNTLSLSGAKTDKVKTSNKQRTTYFDLNDTHRTHAWLRANISAFARTIVGPGMSISEDPFFGEEATKDEKELLYHFYHGIEGRDFKNISDWYPASSKVLRTVGQYRLFGQSVWEIRRNGFDEAISYDIVPGYIFPHVEDDGSFKDPPFYQYVSEGSYMHPLALDPDDIVIFMNPDLGARMFATDFEALAEYTLPTDLYLNLAMRSSLENYRTPLGIYTLNEFASDEDVDNFSTKLDALYRGPAKYGSSAVIVRGETDFRTFSAPLKDLPFGDGHKTMQDEIEGISGVSGAKLGRTDEVNRSNMRELRRDYWETTHQPVVVSLADQMYLLVHMRTFGIRAWRPMFNAPDFLTQVEKATVGMRGRQNSGLSTNEFRQFVFNLPPIEEEWADNDYMSLQGIQIRAKSLSMNRIRIAIRRSEAIQIIPKRENKQQ